MQPRCRCTYRLQRFTTLNCWRSLIVLLLHVLLRFAGMMTNAVLFVSLSAQHVSVVIRQSTRHSGGLFDRRRAYRALRKQNSETYWRDRERGCPRSLCSSFYALIGRRDAAATGESMNTLCVNFSTAKWMSSAMRRLRLLARRSCLFAPAVYCHSWVQSVTACRPCGRSHPQVTGQASQEMFH